MDVVTKAIHIRFITCKYYFFNAADTLLPFGNVCIMPPISRLFMNYK